MFDSLWHFIAKCYRYYYKMWQLFYYQMRQKFITKMRQVFYKMRQFYHKMQHSYYKLWRFYYKMWQLLQNATFITNCDSTNIIADQGIRRMPCTICKHITFKVLSQHKRSIELNCFVNEIFAREILFWHFKIL